MLYNRKHTYKNSKKLYRNRVMYTWNRVVICMLFVSGICSSGIAGTSSVHSNMLFLHSFFQNKHWQRSGDTIDYEMPSSYTSLTPVKTSMAGNDTDNIALFSTTSNKLYLMHAVLEPPPSISSNYKMKVFNPAESSVGSADSAFGVFASTSDNLDIIFCATAGASNNIAAHRMLGQNFSVFQIDTLTISLPSVNCKITNLFGGPDLAKGNQSCIWVTGTYGLIRFFSWNGTAWSTETVYDIDSTETVSAFSLEAVGTNSGKIYIDQSGSFVYNSQPTTKPINQITATGAVSNDGTVLKKKGSQWTAFTVGSADYNYFNFVPRTDGSGVELLDDSWQYYIYTLEDTPTSFDILPPEVAVFINSGYYNYQGSDPETVTVILNDPDGNCLVPEVTINSSVSLTFDGTDTLKNMHPDTACVPGFKEIADTILTLILTYDTVYFSAQARNAKYNPVSFKYYWAYSTFENSESWFESDQLIIKLGEQSLLIINNEGTTIVSPQNAHQAIKQLSVYRKSTGLVFNFQQNTIHSIRIFNPAGRQLAYEHIASNTNKVVLPIRMSSGVVCIEYCFKDGTVQRNILPLVR